MTLAACGGPAGPPRGVRPPAGDDHPSVRTPSDELPIIGAPVAMPRVFARISCGDPAGQLLGMALYADHVEHGAGALFAPPQVARALGELVGVDSLDGVDLSRPIHVVLGPSDDGKFMPIVIATVDEAAMRASLSGSKRTRAVVHHGVAAIGPADALRSTAPWALTSLVATEASPGISGSIYPGTMPGNGVDELEMTLRALAVKALGEPSLPAVEAFVGMLREIDRIDGRLVVDRDHVELSADLAVRPGGAFAALIALQRPTDFAFAKAVGDQPVVAAGAIDWGALEPAIAAAASGMLGIPVAALGPASGWLALGREPADGSAAVLLKLAPADEVARLAGLARPTPPATGTAGTPPLIHRVKTPRSRRGVAYEAVADASVGFVFGGSAASLWAQRGTPARRGRGLSAATGAVLDGARSRRESAAVSVDLQARTPGLGPAIAFGLGFEGGAVHLRASIPAEQLSVAVH